MSKKPREPFNTYSHLAGALLSALGMIYLVITHLTQPTALISFLVFGLGCIFLYTSSTIYHWLSLDRPWLQRLDHSAIYVMIAGSYTPICLLALSEPTKWIVLSLQWGLALFGVILSLTRDKTPTPIRLTLYLVMGWMVIAFTGDFLANSGLTPLIYLFAGGLAYTLGAVVYSTKKPNPLPQSFGSHGLWHLFVLTGTLCHFGVMLTIK